MKQGGSILNLVGRRRDSESQRLAALLAHAPWDLRPVLICRAACVQLSLEVRAIETAIGSTSTLLSADIQTLHDLITRDVNDGGLAMSWEEWSLDVEAAVKKSAYNIAAESRDEVLLQYGDIVHTLGREPISADDYHRAKEAVLSARIQSEAAAFEAKIEKLADVNRSLTLDLSQAQHELESARASSEASIQGLEQVAAQLREQVQGLSVELSQKRSKFSTELEERAFAAYQDKLTAAEEEIEARARLFLSDSMERAAALSLQVEALSQELASRNLDLANLHIQLEATNAALTKQSASGAEALKRIEEQEERIEVLQSELLVTKESLAASEADCGRLKLELEAEIEKAVQIELSLHSIEAQIGSFEVGGQSLSASDIVELCGKLTTLQSANKEIRFHSRKLRARNAFIDGRFKEAKERLVREMGSARDLRAKLCVSQHQLKLARFALLGMAAVSAATWFFHAIF